MIYSSMFRFISFYGHIHLDMLQIYVTPLMLKVIVSFTDTPFLYGTRNIKHDDN